ncbi:substrate-binding domain-containing protein [Novosphingobium sp. Gsoil 351]|uniref:substrate-binding domain-containing protein n=1 Tax=Novosphingobium sp. Gsoil 351 TaxID=2675225 RepID=UPI0012B47D89|nr:substrate-binding domain-containing protein [Novosphingobium sp. Gsoil 351]QGN55802.1 substrate-binding domain-containing protein [Novosphingobium sp. Gsoil 351]
MLASSQNLIALIIARATMLAYPELLPELARALQRADFRFVLEVIEHERDADQAMLTFANLDVAGIIAAARPSEDSMRLAQARGVPLLLYNCHADGPTVDSVSCDHAASGQALASLLLDAGHRRFGIIASPSDSLVGVERAAGAVKTLNEGRALTIEVVPGDYSYESGAAALDALFARMKPRPSAIIAINDAMAIGALDRARALQVRIPRDLSIVGIDGTQTARLPSYDLTTMRQPLRRLAAMAVERLQKRIADVDRPAEVRLYAAELIRGTTARLERPVRKSKANAAT